MSDTPTTILPALRYRFDAALVDYEAAIRQAEDADHDYFALKSDRDARHAAVVEAHQEVAKMFHDMLQEYVALRQLVENIAERTTYSTDLSEAFADAMIRARNAARFAGRIEERWSDEHCKVEGDA